jgi:hypothetical protein
MGKWKMKWEGTGDGPHGKPKCRQAHAISGSQRAPPEKEEERCCCFGDLN